MNQIHSSSSSSRSAERSLGRAEKRYGTSGRRNTISGGSRTSKRRARPTRVQNKTIAKKPTREKRIRQGRMDISFFFLVIVLVTIGLIMVFSASYATSLYENDSGYTLVRKQVIYVALGMVAMYILSYIPYQLYFKMYKLVYFVCLALTASALLFRDTSGRGARRWIKFGGFSFQPSELLKFGIIVVFAALISINFRQMGTIRKGIIPFIAYLIPAFLIIILQRHMSWLMLVALICGFMLLVAGAKVYYLALLIPMVLVALPIMEAMGFNYVSTRVDAWLDPFSNIQSSSWQVVQSLYAIGSGGLFGVGLGNSTQKFLWVSEPQNDFIFAIVCEELGLIGALAVILLFILFAASGFSIAMRAPDKFSSMVVVGVILQFSIQALLNIAVVTNSMPTTGISLPFFSAGGSATLMQLAQVGVVLNISRYCRPTIAKNKEEPKKEIRTNQSGGQDESNEPSIRIISSRDI